MWQAVASAVSITTYNKIRRLSLRAIFELQNIVDYFLLAAYPVFLPIVMIGDTNSTRSYPLVYCT